MQINLGTIFNPFAFICFFKETDASQKRRFAAAAGPKDDNYLAIFDIQIDTFEDMVFSKAFLYTFNLYHAVTPLSFAVTFCDSVLYLVVRFSQSLNNNSSIVHTIIYVIRISK